MAGWIKISRDIAEHWLWQDAERLKWWLDLLFLAAWEDKQIMHDTHLFVLRKGQIIASVSYLSDRWNKSNPTIIKYLKLLEKEGMIYRQILYRQTPIITICNYERYQTCEVAQVDTIVDRQVDTIVYTNKEYKEYNNNNNINSESKKTNFFQELKLSQIWLEQMAIRFRIGIDDIKKRLDDFALDCDCRGTVHQSLGDIKRHYNDWLRIQLEAEKRQDKQKQQQYESSTKDRQSASAKARRNAEFADYIAGKLGSDSVQREVQDRQEFSCIV